MTRCTVGMLGALVALQVVATQRGPAPDPLIKEGVTTKVAPHTWVIPDGNVGLVPNVGIVVGSRGTLVIDPGLGRKNGETVLRETNKLWSPGPSGPGSGPAGRDLYIASTHFHAEHTTGYVAFPASAKYINSTTQEAEFEQGGMQMVQMFAGRSPVTADLLKDAARRPAAITFDREYTLDLGGVRVRFMVVGPTHTRGDTGLFVEGDNVLFAGDVVMNNSFVAAGPASSLNAWLAALDAFDALKPRVIVPSHGEVGTGALITANREFMTAVKTRTLALKAQGRSIDDAGAAVQAELVAQHPTWPRATGLAALARSAYQEGQ